MTTGTSAEDLRTHDGPAGSERYTVEELARAVGMSTRNIRAHQTRGLLRPPVRAGRTAYYDGRHRRRLLTIRSLQEQGFNLVAIEAVFAGTDGPAPDELGAVLDGVGVDHPGLAQALSRHGVIRRAADGRISPVRSRLLRKALDLDRAGLSPALSLQVLVEVLDTLRPVADELGQATSARILALRHRSGLAAHPAGAYVEGDDTGLHRGLADLLAEVFRAAVGDQGALVSGRRM
jgi:DNA-binding transcriptional MerR regulator